MNKKVKCKKCKKFYSIRLLENHFCYNKKKYSSLAEFYTKKLLMEIKNVL